MHLLVASCHNFSKKEEQSFCQCLNSVNVSQSYNTNIISLVSMQDLKLAYLKSHDCHVLMQQLLSVTIRIILPASVRGLLTRLGLFFNEICKKFINLQVLDDLENEASTLLSQLEM